MLDFGTSRPRQDRISRRHGSSWEAFGEIAKIAFSRGGADLEFSQGQSAIRAPGRGTHVSRIEVFPQGK